MTKRGRIVTYILIISNWGTGLSITIIIQELWFVNAQHRSCHTSVGYVQIAHCEATIQFQDSQCGSRVGKLALRYVSLYAPWFSPAKYHFVNVPSLPSSIYKGQFEDLVSHPIRQTEKGILDAFVLK